MEAPILPLLRALSVALQLPAPLAQWPIHLLHASLTVSFPLRSGGKVLQPTVSLLPSIPTCLCHHNSPCARFFHPFSPSVSHLSMCGHQHSDYFARLVYSAACLSVFESFRTARNRLRGQCSWEHKPVKEEGEAEEQKVTLRLPLTNCRSYSAQSWSVPQRCLQVHRDLLHCACPTAQPLLALQRYPG